MHSFRALVFIFGILSSINCQVTYQPDSYFAFDCRRYIGGCTGGGSCSPLTGNCTCNVDRHGHDCSLPRGPSSQFVNNCAIQCSTAGGMCYRPNIVFSNPEICYCKSSWTGFDCSIRRVTMDCAVDNMVIQVYPQQGITAATAFNGKLAIEMFDTGELLLDPRCTADTFASNGILEWDGSKIQKTISMRNDGPCVAGRKFLSDETGESTCFKVRLMYIQGILTPSDENIQFCCSQEGAVTDVIEVQPRGGGGISVNATITSRPITFEMRWTDTNEIIKNADVVSVGDRITFVARLNASVTSIRDFRLDTCIARAGELQTGGFPLLEDRCRANAAFSVFKAMRRVFDSSSLPEIHIDLSAFRLEPSGKINITCNYTLCSNNNCGGVSLCDNTNIFNYGRRKRSVNTSADEGPESEDNVVKGTLSVLYIIGDGSGDYCPSYTRPEKQTSCLQQETLIAVAVVFGILFLICLLVTIFACAKLMKGKSGNIAPTSK